MKKFEKHPVSTRFDPHYICQYRLPCHCHWEKKAYITTPLHSLPCTSKRHFSIYESDPTDYKFGVNCLLLFFIGFFFAIFTESLSLGAYYYMFCCMCQVFVFAYIITSIQCKEKKTGPHCNTSAASKILILSSFL